MMIAPTLIPILLLGAVAGAAAAEAADGGALRFEELGQPARVQGLAISAVTTDAQGHRVAWGVVQGAEFRGAMGIRLDSGEQVPVNLLSFGNSNVRMAKGLDGNLYFYSGMPGQFLKYDVNAGKVVDLGIPAKAATYWMQHALAPDGRFYIGSYPATHLVTVDTRTGTTSDLGTVAEDKRQKYITTVAVGDDGVAYCAVGLHHCELWAVDARTREKRQILPEELTRPQGAPKVWRGTDGRVYGSVGETRFRCTREGIVPGETAGAWRDADALVVGDETVGSVDAEGRLAITVRKTKKTRFLQTTYRGDALPLFSLGPLYEGKLYGSSIKPGHLFTYEPATGKTVDHEVVTSGSIQVYDVLAHPRGLFLASYVGASLDFLDPAQPIVRGKNPRRITQLHKPYMQERPIQLITGPDGKVYTGTVPVKGHLGGALARIDPETLEVTCWRDVVKNESIMALAPVPETGELVLATSRGGGSSAIPSEPEGFVCLWDTRAEKVVFTTKPVPGTPGYGMVVRARNGIIYGLAGAKYYALDPAKRQVIHVADLPVERVRFPGLHDAPVGPKGLIYGLGDDAVFAIDPADHSVRVIARHESIKAAHGFYVTEDGVLYYGSGSRLMRCRLP